MTRTAGARQPGSAAPPRDPRAAPFPAPSTGRTAFGLVLLAVFANGISVAAPGYFNHDELTGVHADWASFLAHTAHRYVDFDRLFYRPTGLTLFLLYARTRATFLAPHLAQALLHGVACIALFAAARSLGRPRREAALAGALFAALPLTVYAVGWIAGVYDVLFGLFLFAWVAAASHYARCGGSGWALGAALLFIVSLTCKDTAVVGFPLAAGLWLVAWRPAEPRRAARLLALFAAIGVVYLALRLPFVWNHLQAPRSDSYALAVGPEIASRLLAYFAFPFVVNLPDLAPLSAVQALAGALAHASLLALVGLRLGARAVAAYAVGFVLPLLPVLALGKTEAQYLYASGAAPAVALAALIGSYPRWRRGVLLVLPWLLALGAHAVSIQVGFYRTALCQTRLLTSLDAIAGRPPPRREAELRIAAEPGMPDWVLRRTAHPGSIPVSDGALRLRVVARPAEADLRVDALCIVRRDRPPESAADAPPAPGP